MEILALGRKFRLSWLAVRLLVATLALAQVGCYFFRKKTSSEDDIDDDSDVLGGSIGPKAGGINLASLASVYAVTTTHAPAGIRPDPDTYVRRMLLQYRKEGAVVAREIGRVEKYRPLIGGASEDFTTQPAETYDATSILANLKVAEEVCQGLVAPDAAKHPGWNTILPNPPSKLDANLKFLAQRFLGQPSSQIDDRIIASLQKIVDAESGSSTYENRHYIPACMALTVDAEALLL